jgi:hypothetical protein
VKQASFVPEFVETIPEVILEGRLYISTRFRTASHLCACGCGSKVVTPIKPAKWQFTYDGETVSLCPSIGRWQLPCKSHYWICRSKVVWSKAFSEDEMEAVLRLDTEDLRSYYASRQAPQVPESSVTANRSFLARLWRRLNKLRR